MSHANPVDRYVLIENTKLLIADTQELLKLIADQSSQNVTDLRFRLEDKIAQYKKDLTKLQDASLAKVKQVGQLTDEFVHHEPWKVIGITAGVAFILGMLVCRGGKE